VKNNTKLTPKWTGLVTGLPTNSSIEWQCVKKATTGQFENGNSNQLNTINSPYSGSTIGKL
jgi:hypothetical protein